MSTYTDLDGLGSGAVEFGCDLTGTDTCQTVIGLYGNPLSNTTPTLGQFLKWNGTQWTPGDAPSGSFAAGGDLSGTSTNQTVIRIQTYSVVSTAPSNNQVLLWVNANNRWEPTTLTFTGGDLSGTYPATTVAKINGATVPAAGALTTGNVLQVSGASALTYAPVNLAGGANYVTGVLPAANQAAQTMAGDVTGTTAASVVERLRGKNLATALASIGAAQDGYKLTWVNSANEWQATLTSSITWTKDLLGSTDANQYVTRISGDYDATNHIVTLGRAGNSILQLIGEAQTSSDTTGFPIRIYGSNGNGTGGGGSLNLKGGDGGASGIGGNLTLSGGTGTSSGQVQISGSLILFNDPVKFANLTTGILHADSDGDITSSLIVNADVHASAAIAVSKLAAGTAAQFLQNNSTPTPTWTTMSGDGTLSSAGALSVTDLTGASGTVDIAATGNILTWAAATTAPGIAQTSTSGGSGATMSIIAQGATGASNNGGGLVLAGGTSGSATAGTVVLRTANTTRLTAGATGVITIANLSTGVVHADSSGNLTSSNIVNADVDAAAAIAVTKLAAGSADQVLTTNGSTNAFAKIVNANVDAAAAIAGTKISPDFGSQNIVTTGTLTTGTAALGATTSANSIVGSIKFTIKTFSSNGTIDTTTKDTIIYADTSGGAFNLTLPAPTAGRTIIIKDLKQTFATNNLTIVRNAAESIDGVTTSLVLSVNNTQIIFTSDGTNWLTDNFARSTTGAAGGDLSGTYPNPTVAKINGTSVDASPSADEVLTATSSTVSDWKKLVNANIDTAAAIAVSKLAAGTAGQLLLNNSTPTPTWTTMSGDTTISSAGATTLVAIRGKATDTDLATIGAGQDQYVLTWDNAAAEWQAKAATGGSGVTTVGTIDSQTKSANGAVIVTTSIYMQTADASNPGLVSTGTQTMAGAKTWSGAAVFSSTVSTGALTAGTTTTNNTLTGGTIFTTRSLAADLTIDTTTKDMIILVSTAAARAITLPAPVNGRTFIIKDKTGQAETNNITLIRNGSEKIEGIAASRILSTNWGVWTITTDGTDWFFL